MITQIEGLWQVVFRLDDIEFVERFDTFLEAENRLEYLIDCYA